MANFTQDDFNGEHTEPREYGEGDYYVVGDQYSDQEAAEMIGAWETDLTGDPHLYAAEDIQDFKMFVTNKGDSGESEWALNDFSDDEPLAWGKGIAA